MVNRVAEVQLEKSLLENSSAKIAGVPDITWIGSETGLIWLGLVNASVACTV